MNPATNVAVYPKVTSTTCVASQNCVSKTTLTEHPSCRRCFEFPKKLAIQAELKPLNAATALPTPIRNMPSMTKPNTIPPQPMNTAEE